MRSRGYPLPVGCKPTLDAACARATSGEAPTHRIERLAPLSGGSSSMTDVATRFWRLASPRSESECWPWTGFRFTRRWGYGGFELNGRKVRAHRIAWTLTHGPIPAGLWVLHRCDNPPCVNPAHLFLGTVQDNNNDSKAKGRVGLPKNLGSSNPRARVTEDDVRFIRASDDSTATLAARFGLAPRSIRDIQNRSRWKSVL